MAVLLGDNNPRPPRFHVEIHCESQRNPRTFRMPLRWASTLAWLTGRVPATGEPRPCADEECRRVFTPTDARRRYCDACVDRINAEWQGRASR